MNTFLCFRLQIFTKVFKKGLTVVVHFSPPRRFQGASCNWAGHTRHSWEIASEEKKVGQVELMGGTQVNEHGKGLANVFWGYKKGSKPQIFFLICGKDIVSTFQRTFDRSHIIKTREATSG